MGKRKSNIDIVPNIELVEDQIKIDDRIVPIADVSAGDLLKLNGWVLFTQKPILFDIRSVGYDGSGFGGTEEQWQEYLNELPCACCKNLVNDCKCQPPGKYLKGPKSTCS